MAEAAGRGEGGSRGPAPGRSCTAMTVRGTVAGTRSPWTEAAVRSRLSLGEETAWARRLRGPVGALSWTGAALAAHSALVAVAVLAHGGPCCGSDHVLLPLAPVLRLRRQLGGPGAAAPTAASPTCAGSGRRSPLPLPLKPLRCFPAFLCTKFHTHTPANVPHCNGNKECASHVSVFSVLF